MGKKIWDYEDYEDSLESCIDNLLEKKKTIVSITILKYADSLNSNTKQTIFFPIRALILYN
jgi:hypothetical protein